jgi:hypothetical protein
MNRGVDMNRNQEAFGNFEEFDRLERRFLEWLQADSRSSGTPDGGLPTEETVISSGSPQSSSDDPTNGEVDDLDPLLSEDLEFLAMYEMGSDGDSSDTSVNLVSDVDRLHKSGDTPVIEERSQTILKSRLRTEIEHHPPLFPWETEIVEYEPETIDFTQAQVVPSMFGHSYSHRGVESGIGFWTPQLPKMNGLTPLPHEVLGQLLEQCSQAMKSNLREWAKLVQVVEKSLFPGHSRELNEMASRLSIAQQHRSSTTTDANLLPKISPIEKPIAYEVATPTQQMLMSLLAAREIIGNLTLELSSSQPKLERQWLTAAGLLALNIEYQPENLQGDNAIAVSATLPCGGSVSLTGGQSQTQSERLNPGVLSLELSDRHLQENYLLEVHLDSAEQHSLTFALRVRR